MPIFISPGAPFKQGLGETTVPIFDAGRNQANLEDAKANREITVARYEKASEAARG